jgi:cell division protein FtsW
MLAATANRSSPPPERLGRDLRPLASLLVSLVLLLLVGGMAILGSASGTASLRLSSQAAARQAQQATGEGAVPAPKVEDPYIFLRKQLLYAALAAGVLVVCARLDYRAWKRLCVPFALASLALLVGVLFTEPINGSRRWISLQVFQLQPSEPAKVALVALLAAYLSLNRRRLREFWVGLAVPLALVGLFSLLVLAEPDYGTTLLLCSVGVLLLFLSGVSLGPLTVLSLAGAVSFVLLVLQNPLRTRRIVAFLNPERYSDQEAFQQIAAKHAFILGGATGEGFGQGMQQQHYLPEAHTDFIYAILGEELGLSATLAVLAVYLIIFLLGLRIAQGAADHFGRLLATGLTLVITLQALINMAVVTGLMPNKGLPLPFISYGGSSLLVCAAMVGMLVSVARVSSDARILHERNPVKDRARWV